MSKIKEHHHDEIEAGMRAASVRVIFVGIHNKPGLKPLDSFTKSGKLIDRIIADLFGSGILSIKTNLYDTQIMPLPDKKPHLVFDFYNRVNPNDGDIIVMLGNEVKNNITKKLKLYYLPLRHPASIWSRTDQVSYVTNAIELITLIYNSHIPATT